jgi:hypothetical protein
MKNKIILLSVVMITMSVYAGAQSARNPLNLEPIGISIKKNPSSWKLTEETMYYADGTMLDKRSFSYDTNSHKISETNQQWSAEDNAWKETSKASVIKAGNKYTEITDGKQNKTKVETIYNTDNKPVYSLLYSWNKDNEAWSVDASLKCEWVYDTNGNIAKYIKQRWNKEKNEWNKPFAQIIYSYNAAEEVVEELYRSWNQKDDSWIDAGKYIYSDIGKNQKSAKSYVYIYGEWMPDGEIVYTYDEDGKVSRADYYKKSSQESLSAYSLYSYSENFACEVIAEAEGIDIYPNPAVSSFELTVPETLVGKTANIFDSWGKQVKSVIVKDGKTNIEINGLRSGIYMLRIGENAKKLVVAQ